MLYLADNGWNQFGKIQPPPYENGIRTPIIARWPAGIKAHKEDVKTASQQHRPGFRPSLAACEVEVPKAMPGINLLDDKAVSIRTAIFFNNFSHNMISRQKNPPRASGPVPSSRENGSSSPIRIHCRMRSPTRAVTTVSTPIRTRSCSTCWQILTRPGIYPRSMQPWSPSYRPRWTTGGIRTENSIRPAEPQNSSTRSSRASRSVRSNTKFTRCANQELARDTAANQTSTLSN